MTKKMSLELKDYQNFRLKYEFGDYNDQRFGQAFYNYFKLERVTNQSYLKDLYERDGEDAKELIRELFDFN